MRLRTLGVLLALVVAFALPAAAQDTRGRLEGLVKDNTGAVLPGATVEARGVNGSVSSTVSDASGAYRFPALPPGEYEVSAAMQGFGTQKARVVIAIGQVVKFEFGLQLQGLAENVQVTAEAPLVDVRQSSRATNIRGEQLDLIPHARDFTAVVTQAPGVNDEPRLGGISIDGASASENRFMIDGTETTNLQSGLSGQPFPVDFMDDVQVRRSGYPAEYGGAIGGVISAVTKTGTNQFRGLGSLNWYGDKTEAGANPTLRISLTDSNVAEYVTYPEDSYNRLEPAVSVGGPIATNRAWFYAGYQPTLVPTSRTVQAGGASNTVDQKNTTHNFLANQTTAITNNLRSKVSYTSNWRRAEGLLPALNGTDPAGTNYSKTSTFPNWSLSAQADWTASSKFFVGVKGGYRMQDQYDTNVTEEPQFIFQGAGNIGLAGVPAEFQHAQSFTSIPSNQKVDRDKFTRAYFQADATYFGNFGGQHQIKGGLQFDRLGNDVLRGNARPVVRLFWNQSLATGSPAQRGTFGYYEVRTNAVDLSKGIVTEGNVHSNNVGLFIQDSWTIGDRLSVELGLRTEREQVPAYLIEQGIPDFGIEFSFADKLAPRAGFSYDLRGDSRSKVSGSWGIFYDYFKLELPRGSFGGDKWISYYYALDQANYPALLSDSGCPPACPGTRIRGPIDFRHPSFGSDAIEPDLKPMRAQEFTLGFDQQLGNTMAVGVHYVHKQLDRTIEDTGSLDADGNEIYIIANPSEGLTANAFPGVKMPKPKRQYDAVEFSFDKRTSKRWFMRASYTWTRLYGNYSGLSQSDEAGRTSPNVGRGYDYPLMMFNGRGQAEYGPLATDRPNQVKLQTAYMFDFGTTVGLGQSVFSGVPITREAAVLPTSNYPVQYLGRGSDGRSDILSQTDIFVRHAIRMGGNRQLQLEMTVLNLFNQAAVLSKFQTQLRSGNGLVFNESAFYAGQVDFNALINAGIAATRPGAPSFVDPRFLMPNAYQDPLRARFAVKFLF